MVTLLLTEGRSFLFFYVGSESDVIVCCVGVLEVFYFVFSYLHIFFVAVRLTDAGLKIKLHDLAIKESVPTASRLDKLK